MKSKPEIKLPEFYTYEVDSNKLVWFPETNQFLLVEDPVYQVVNAFSIGLGKDEINLALQRDYQVTSGEASGFVDQIKQQFLELGCSTFESYENQEDEIQAFYKQVTYRIQSYSFQVYYPNARWYNSIHPWFHHIQSNDSPRSSYTIESTERAVYLKKESHKSWTWTENTVSYLKGRLFLEIMNDLHHAEENNWLATVHGLAVSNGKQAVIITGVTESGKSTLGLRLMQCGYTILSDDYVLVNRKSQKVVPIPIAQSVRENYPPFVDQVMLDAMKDGRNPYKLDIGKTIYIPSKEYAELEKFSSKATHIVFIRYNSDAQSQFVELNKRQLLQKIFSQTWVPPYEECARGFIDWLREITAYQMNFNDIDWAFEKIDALFT